MWNLLKIFVTFGLILLETRHIIGSPVMSINRVSNRPNKRNTQNTAKIRSNSFQLSRDPWLYPTDGILASGKTKIIALMKDTNANLLYNEFTDAINVITSHSNQLTSARIHKVPVGRREKRTRYSKGKSVKGKKISSVVYPELAIAVSYDYFKKFNLDYYAIIPYLLSFWNAVDMRYRGLENPKYRFYISQFIFESEPGDFKFLENNGSPDFLTLNSIFNARQFWYEQDAAIPLNSYDMMIVMTGSIICSKFNKETNECDPHIYGQAWPSSACSIDHDEREINKVTIISDNGAYNGISVATHEIGHSLGAYHDGTAFYNSTTETWGPVQCDLELGYIMSGNKQASRNSFEWSECSIRNLEEFINSKEAKCLYNKPSHIGRPIPRYLPGKLMNADEQCKRAGAIESCEGEVSNCVMLQCRFKDEGCTNTSAPAVEGTHCGTDTIAHICIHGECVAEYDLV